jgi:hypothetical protein
VRAYEFYALGRYRRYDSKVCQYLSGRIRRARHAVEEERWRRSLGGVVGNVGTLSLQLESEGHWYTKPSGLLLIGLIIEVIGGLKVLLWGRLLFGARVRQECLQLMTCSALLLPCNEVHVARWWT